MEEIGKFLPAIFRSYLQRETPRVVEVLAPLWSHVVGRAVAEHSRPVAFAGGTLRLEASCPSWGVQLRRMSEEIRAEVNHYLGHAVVKKVTVQHGSIGRGSRVHTSGGDETSTPDWDTVSSRSRPPGPERSSAAPRMEAISSSGPHLRAGQSSAESCGLPPEVARILERSFAKYFSRAAVRSLSRKEN